MDIENKLFFVIKNTSYGDIEIPSLLLKSGSESQKISFPGRLTLKPQEEKVVSVAQKVFNEFKQVELHPFIWVVHLGGGSSSPQEHQIHPIQDGIDGVSKNGYCIEIGAYQAPVHAERGGRIAFFIPRPCSSIRPTFVPVT